MSGRATSREQRDFLEASAPSPEAMARANGAARRRTVESVLARARGWEAGVRVARERIAATLLSEEAADLLRFDFAEALDAAAAAEVQRIAAILEAASEAERDQAVALAIETDLSAVDAIRVLKRGRASRKAARAAQERRNRGAVKQQRRKSTMKPDSMERTR